MILIIEQGKAQAPVGYRTKAKYATSCGNAFVTNIVLA